MSDWYAVCRDETKNRATASITLLQENIRFAEERGAKVVKPVGAAWRMSLSSSPEQRHHHVIFGQTARRMDILMYWSVINRFLHEVRDATAGSAVGKQG